MNLSQFMLINVMLIKRVYLHSSQTQTILLVTLAYLTVSRNANLFVHEKLTKLLSWSF